MRPSPSLSALLLLLLPSQSSSYSRGAPDTACTDRMLPRHGYDIQAGPPPAEILVDSQEITSQEYLRVTLRAKAGTFKGFLVKAVEVVDGEGSSNAYAQYDAIGSWYIPFTGDNSTSYSSVSTYVACDGVHQRAVTLRDANTPLTAVPLQWTPSTAFHGTVVLTATIVSNYSHYWTNLQSIPVTVTASDRRETESSSEVSPATVRSVEAEKSEKSTVKVENVLNDNELLELLSQVIHSKTSQTDQTDVQATTSKYIINNYREPQLDTNIDIILQNSSRDRSPRFENQHLYEKIEAEYGAWENCGSKAQSRVLLGIFCLLIVSIKIF